MSHRYYLFVWNPDLDEIQCQIDADVSARKIQPKYLDHVMLKVPHVEVEPEEVTLRRLKHIGKWYRENALRKAKTRAQMKEYEPVSKWINESDTSRSNRKVFCQGQNVIVCGCQVRGPYKRPPKCNADIIDLT